MEASDRIRQMNATLETQRSMPRTKLVVAGEKYGWRVVVGPWVFWVPPGSSASVPACARLERWVPATVEM